MEIRNGPNLYRVYEKVADSINYRLYLCEQDATKRQCLLQIATAVGHNGKLDRAAYILKELKRYADEVEKEYMDKNKGKDSLNYELGFPELVDSFVYPEQNNKRVNIYAFRCVENVHSMIPLVFITKQRLRVDLRTSAWIMGKALKVIDFSHNFGIAVCSTRGNNILIERDNRYVVIFDWTLARIYPETIPIDLRRQDISQAAQAIITVLGGDWENGFIPDDEEKTHGLYINNLLQLARGSESSARRAHANFYEIVDRCWKREFYPFTTKPLVD